MDAPPPSFAAALAAQRAGEWAEAEQGYRLTLERFPDAQPAHHNLVGVLEAQGKWAEAEAALRRALQLWPEHAEFRFSLAKARLAAGDLAEGFQLYEARRELADGPQLPRLSLPEWDGAAVRSLLVWPEQGFGDQILFARFIPLLQSRGIEVTLLCGPELRRLFEPLGAELIVASGEVAVPQRDAWAPIGSLARLLGVTTPPPPAPLRGSASSHGGVGVAARGNPRLRSDGVRSLAPELADELLRLPGARSLAPEDTGATDFQDTADIIAGLDLVICIDSAVANLAASLGKPTWVLQPAALADWRWGRTGASTPWFPSARLFRHPRPASWRVVLDEVLAAFAAI